MTTRQKNLMKATFYVIIGTTVEVFAAYATIRMWFSGTFLPVYIGTTYVIGNQLLRYEIYLILFSIIGASEALVVYGAGYLARRFRRFRFRRFIRTFKA